MMSRTSLRISTMSRLTKGSLPRTLTKSRLVSCRKRLRYSAALRLRIADFPAAAPALQVALVGEDDVGREWPRPPLGVHPRHGRRGRYIAPGSRPTLELRGVNHIVTREPGFTHRLMSSGVTSPRIAILLTKPAM